MALALLGILFIAIGLTALALQRFYSAVPARELKRLAARGDQMAAALYTPVAYGASMRLLLWALFCLGLSGGFSLVFYNAPGWVAFAVVAASLAVGVILQSVQLTVSRAQFAVKLTPALDWLLAYLHAPFDFAARQLNRYRGHAWHSGLYEKEDLLELLERQKEQPGNRMSEREITILTRAALFDERQAADIAQPMSRIKLISADENIGPILLGELYDSGQASFLVYEDSPEKVAGTLLLQDAVSAREGGKVRSLMQQRLCFVHEDFSLRQVLRAFSRTGQFMAVVVNGFEEPVGVITLTHLLEELLDEGDAQEFEAFDSLSAVAAFKAKPSEFAAEQIPVQEVPSSPEVTEVVESEKS